MTTRGPISEATDLELTYRGLCQATWIHTLRNKVAATRADLARQEEFLQQQEREFEQLNQELRNRKYHDVGHARTQFESKIVEADGKKTVVWLKSGEMTPEVRAYLNRAASYDDGQRTTGCSECDTGICPAHNNGSDRERNNATTISESKRFSH